MCRSCAALTARLPSHPPPAPFPLVQASGMGRVLLGGNYASGVALGKCVEHGYELATDIAGQVAAAKAGAA